MSLFGFLRKEQNFNYSRNKRAKSNQNLISIIVPFRNEANRIHELLSSLEKQSYSLVVKEIIFIDDHSTDHSFVNLKKWACEANFKTKIIALSSEKGKKHAIHLGIKNASAPYVLLLDADVNFGSNFLSELATNNFTPNELVLIPVVETSGIVWSRITSYVLSVITIGMARINLPVLANGAGILFCKAAYFASNPFGNNYAISSGDDLFLLEAFIRKIKSGLFPQNLYLLRQGALLTLENILRDL